MITPRGLDNRSDDTAPQPPDRKTPASRRRRRIIASSAIFLGVVGLLLMNAVVVAQQDVESIGDPILSLDGENIHVRQDGPRDAPALVLIHGFAGSVHWWDPLVPVLAKSYRIICVDLLGHGRSAKPAGDGYGIPEQGRRVGAALDRLGVQHAVVIGHSTGGSVATALAEQRRDLVTAIALINTGPRLDAYIAQESVSRLTSVPVVGQLLWRLRTDSLIRRSVSTAFTREIDIPQQLVDDVRGMTYHAFTATSQAADNYQAQRSIPDRLVALDKPLLVIFGEEDRRWRSSSAAEYRVVPGATVELLPGVGHAPMLEDPPRTAALLLAFAAIHAA